MTLLQVIPSPSMRRSRRGAGAVPRTDGHFFDFKSALDISPSYPVFFLLTIKKIKKKTPNVKNTTNEKKSHRKVFLHLPFPVDRTVAEL